MLIDRVAAMAAIETKANADRLVSLANVKDALNSLEGIAPAADVAPVVHCQDCKHARKSKEAFEFDAVTPLCECSYMKLPHRWYEYCSWGERRSERMRLIDADAIAPKLEGKFNQDMVRYAPTINPYNWISVKEDLPPCSGSYFVATKNGGVTITHFYESSQRFSGRLHRLVTHWMELPEPPREGEKE